MVADSASVGDDICRDCDCGCAEIGFVCVLVLALALASGAIFGRAIRFFFFSPFLRLCRLPFCCRCDPATRTVALDRLWSGVPQCPRPASGVPGHDLPVRAPRCGASFSCGLGDCLALWAREREPILVPKAANRATLAPDGRQSAPRRCVRPPCQRLTLSPCSQHKSRDDEIPLLPHCRKARKSLAHAPPARCASSPARKLARSFPLSSLGRKRKRKRKRLQEKNAQWMSRPEKPFLHASN